MNGQDSPAGSSNNVRAIMLAQEINRQCDQLLAIISRTLTDFAAPRADSEAHPRWQVRGPSE